MGCKFVLLAGWCDLCTLCVLFGEKVCLQCVCASEYVPFLHPVCLHCVRTNVIVMDQVQFSAAGQHASDLFDKLVLFLVRC